MSDTTIQIRRDTAANWSSVNPILADGELGLDQTSTLLRVGDGATAWNSLTGKFLSNSADATHDGYLTSIDWNTFNSKQNALTFGNLTEATSSILTITGGTGAVIGTGTSIQVTQSSTSTSGYLSSTDWNTFNSKQAAITWQDVTAGSNKIALGGTPTGSVFSAFSIDINEVNLNMGNMTGVVKPNNGGTGQSIVAQGDLFYVSTSGPPGIPVVSRLAKNTTATRYLSNTGTSNNPAWAQVNLTNGVTGVLPAANHPNAAADDATKGIATFHAADFNDDGAGLISIDYANGQKATVSQPGFLTSIDWQTFNGKQAAITWQNVTAGSSKITLGGTPTGSVFSAFSVDVNEANLTISNMGGTLGVTHGGTGTATQFTQGSVVFAGASGVYSQDNSKFFWDDTNFALCIGTVTQAGAFTVVGFTGAANTIGQTGASITGGVGGTSSTSSTAGAGGPITITTGAGGTSSFSGAGGAGGLLTLAAGNGGAGSVGSSGIGGRINITAGNGTASTGGGVVTSAGGLIALLAGTGGSGTGGAGSSSGGAITITGGPGGAQTGSNGPSGSGGNITLSCGGAGTNNTNFVAGSGGGSFSVSGGAGSGSPGTTPGGSGGSISITSGVGGNSFGAAGGNGGSVTILANSAGTSGSGGGSGGSVTINPGAATGTGTAGSVFICNNRGNLGVGSVTPTAQVHIAAGTASLAPLKLTSGTNLTSAAAGAFEFDGTNLYFTPAATRRTVPLIPGTDYQTPITTSVANSGTTPTTLTTSAAAVIGTITIATAGTYLIQASFDFTLLDTFSADTNFTFTFRRTNNTAANVGNALPITVSNYSYASGSGFTETWGVITLPAVSYVASAGDIITVNGNGITTLNGGTWKVGNSWSISAIRIA